MDTKHENSTADVPGKSKSRRVTTELWGLEQDLGWATSVEMAATVAPHEAILYRLSPVTE